MKQEALAHRNHYEDIRDLQPLTFGHKLTNEERKPTVFSLIKFIKTVTLPHRPMSAKGILPTTVSAEQLLTS